MPRSATRKTTPLSPVKSNDEVIPPNQTRRTARTRAGGPSAIAISNNRHRDKRLGAVEEEIDTTSAHALQTVRQNASSHETIVSREAGHRVGTARRVPSIRASVYDDIAPTEVQVKLMIKHLTELNFRADEVLSQLELYSAQQLVERLSNRQSLAWNDFSEDAIRLERERQHYCVDTDFLQIDAISQKLAAKGLQTTGASYIYAKANLALFSYRLIETHSVEIHNLLVILSSIQLFPEVFSTTSDLAAEDSAEYEDDFKAQTTLLGLEILTQCLIFYAKRNAEDPKFDHAKALKDIFYDGNNVRDVSLGMTSKVERDAYTKLAQSTANTVSRTISEQKNLSTSIVALEERYSWIEFFTQAIAWVKVRAEQIELALQQAGGVRAVKHHLQQSVMDVDSKDSRRKSRSSKANEEFVGKVNFLKNIDDNLNTGDADSQPEEEDDKGHERGGTRQGTEKQPQSEVEESPRSARILREIVPESPEVYERLPDTAHDHDHDQDQDQDQSNLVNDDEPVGQEIPDSAQSPSVSSVIKPTQETSAVLRILKRQAKEGNKENSPPAQPLRAPGREITDPSEISVNPNQVAPSQNGKRMRRDEDDESEDDEDDFETVKRQTKRPRPQTGRQAAPSTHDRHVESDMFVTETVEAEEQSRQPSHQAVHRSTQNDQQGLSSTQPAPTRSLSAHPARAPSSTAPPSSSMQQYEHAKRHARANTSFAAAVAPQSTLLRPPQTRRAWSADEIERLMYLMRQYGCAWSTIKKADDRMIDPQLTGRSQVQLKDKARNMKMDFLKAEMSLPEELSAVTISKAHKEMLKAMNIAYPGEEDEE